MKRLRTAFQDILDNWYKISFNENRTHYKFDGNWREVTQRIENIKIKGKTTFMIAHRFSSIRLANRILVMDQGEIIADGKHEEIYHNCEIYQKLYDQQFSEAS